MSLAAAASTIGQCTSCALVRVVFVCFELEGLRSAPFRSQASATPQRRRGRHRLPRGFAMEGMRSAPSNSRRVTVFDGALPASSFF